MYKPVIPRPVLDPSSWQEKSACRGMDTEIFFDADFARGAPKRAHEAAAKAVCATCPVIQQCLVAALESGEPHGVWGGLTPEERDAHRKGDELAPIPRTDRLVAEVARRWAWADQTMAGERREYG